MGVDLYLGAQQCQIIIGMNKVRVSSFIILHHLRCIEISYASSNKLDEDFFLKESVLVPTLAEQHQIGSYFTNLDHLITLHQRTL